MVHPFARLLLATEGGAQDAGAEALALALARACALPLQAVLPLPANAEFESVAPQLAARADAQAAQRRQSLLALAQAQQVALTVQVRRGAEIHTTIVQAARELQADLLVIRRRGPRGLLAQLLVGEMVGRVVAQAPCSVLIVPRAARLWQHGVLVGVDPVRAQLHAVARAASIASACALPLHVLSVAAVPAQGPQAEQTLETALQLARRVHPASTGAVRQGRAHEVLLQHARERGDDLLVLARGMRGRFSRQGTALKVVGLAECPVLVDLPSAAAAAA